MNISQHSLIETLLGVLSTIVVVIAVTFVIVRVRDKRLMSGRMLGTGLLTLAMIFVIVPAMHKGGRDVIGGVFFTVAWGWCLAIIWVPAISGAVGNLFGGLYDGGGQAVEAKPFYSIFSSKRSQGKYYEALAEIRRQLEKFPEDFQGLIHLAELQAENLDDLPGAAVTIDRLCQQRDRTPSEIAFALNRLADWRLELIKDPDAAREALEKIIQLLPDSEMSQRAAQRIAHLASADSLLAAEQPRTITMRKGPENLGLIREQGKLKVPEPDKDAESQSLVEHLHAHPHDNDARKRLAVLYARHYHRLDLAVDQLEQMIAQPVHTPSQIVLWLNLMAELQTQCNADFDAVRATLQRIIEMYPGLPAAHNAQRRIDLLRREVHAQAGLRRVALGDYEQNIGLKRHD